MVPLHLGARETQQGPKNFQSSAKEDFFNTIRHLATREGWCYQHVQAITVAIDQYAAKAYGNHDYFLNKPYSIGGGRKEDGP